MIFNHCSIIGILNGSPNRLSYGVFPSAKTSWTFSDVFEDSNSIPKSDHHLSSRPDCSNTATEPSFTRRTALCSDAIFSRIDEVLERNDLMLKVDMLSLIHRVVCVYNSRSVRRLQELTKLISVSRGFCCARFRLNPLCGKNLHHDGVPVIVSGFTSLIKDFVIRRYQTFLHQVELRQCADVEISVFPEVSINAVVPRFRCHLRRMFGIRVLRHVCGCMQFFTIFSLNSFNQSGISANGSSEFFSSIFRVSIPVSWLLVRHFALTLKLKMSLMQPCFQRLGVHFPSTSPVITMLRKNCS